MNGLHVFPNKEKAYSEILRTLKSGGELLACFYILPAMCKTDHITFEAMGAILHRNKTLASGDDCCLYYMTKPGSEAEHRWQDEHPDGTFINK